MLQAALIPGREAMDSFHRRIVSLSSQLFSAIRKRNWFAELSRPLMAHSGFLRRFITHLSAPPDKFLPAEFA